MAPRGEPGDAGRGRVVWADGESGRVRLAVTGRAWAVPPQKLLVHHTALWVELTNRGELPLRFRPEDFVMETEKGTVPAEEPRHLVRSGATGSLEETRVLRALGLRAATLAPGETRGGFLFFRRRFSADEAHASVRLEARLYDEQHREPLDRVAVPLEVVP